MSVKTFHLKDYEKIVGHQVVEELYLIGERTKGLKIRNVNSTAVGGGVAEILTRMIPLLKDVGVDASWDVIKGKARFYQATKRFHNALHGNAADLSEEDFDAFLATSEENGKAMDMSGDVLFIHDPQPITLIEQKSRQKGKWVWRCHVDVSNPDQRVWDFLRRYMDQYDATVFSAPMFSRSLPNRQFLIAPSIDPLAEKNKELSEKTIQSVLDKYKLDLSKPMVTQVSRFDYLKDPIGVIEAVEMVQRYVDCQLVLVGGEAADDPESTEVLAKVRERAQKNPDVHVLAIPSGSDVEINALQRASAVVVQKSIKEGFGLTVSEALWKAKPVVASAVGGITLQITHQYSGLLCHSVEGAAHQIKQLLQNPKFAEKLGKNGQEHVKQNFLLTRHLRDYLLLFLALTHDGDVVHL